MASLVDSSLRDKYIPSEKINAVKNQAVMEADPLMANRGSCQPAYAYRPSSNNATNSKEEVTGKLLQAEHNNHNQHSTDKEGGN